MWPALRTCSEQGLTTLRGGGRRFAGRTQLSARAGPVVWVSVPVPGFWASLLEGGLSLLHGQWWPRAALRSLEPSTACVPIF